MKIWVDDIRKPPSDGYIWCKSVYQVMDLIVFNECYADEAIEVIDMDHDAGDYAKYGGDYIRILDWLEETNRNCLIRLHSANPVGVQNMRRIIRKNGWREIL